MKVIYFAFGALTTWQLLLWLIPKLKLRLMDFPNSRSNHSIPIPRGGGVGFLIPSFIGSVFLLVVDGWNSFFFLPIACTPLAFVGLADDRFKLPAKVRYFAQLLTGIMILQFTSLPITFVSLPIRVLLFGFLLFSITAVINFVNFMDGSDGLVAGCLLIVFIAASIAFNSPASIWIWIGSLLVFLFFNWHPAKVFMGDVGSTFLGALLSGLALQSNNWVQALGILLISFPLLSDACICVLRRRLNHQNIFKPHKLHLYQRLHMSGWSQNRVAISYMCASCLIALGFLVGGLQLEIILTSFTLVVGVLLDRNAAISFSQASSEQFVCSD